MSIAVTRKPEQPPREPVECACCGEIMGYEDTFDKSKSPYNYTCSASCARDFYD